MDTSKSIEYLSSINKSLKEIKAALGILLIMAGFALAKAFF
jgi:hypothetical protein